MNSVIEKQFYERVQQMDTLCENKLKILTDSICDGWDKPVADQCWEAYGPDDVSVEDLDILLKCFHELGYRAVYHFKQYEDHRKVWIIWWSENEAKNN